MTPLPFKISSAHLLLYVSLSLLWGVSSSTTTSAAGTLTSTATDSARTERTIETLTTLLTTQPTTKSPPANVADVTVTAKNETSITLSWDKVDNISTYLIQYTDNVNNVTESQGTTVTYTISPLTAGTKYTFTIITLSKGIRSSGRSVEAFTAPANVADVTVTAKNETSITLSWDKVNDISTYLIRYVDKGIDKEKNVTESQGTTVTISPLTAGTKYTFTVITLFEGQSSGRSVEAFTAPANVASVTVTAKNETSITLTWDKVNDISTYMIRYVDKGIDKEKNITESQGTTVTISPLTAGTKYTFTVITVSQGQSSGRSVEAFTAPANVAGVTVTAKNETSITLSWDKVNDISTYLIRYTEKGIDKEKNITESQGTTVTISPLTAGTKYTFTIITVSQGQSSGRSVEAFTVPANVSSVTVTAKNETSITLRWDKVNGISTYMIRYTEKGIDKEKNVTESQGMTVTYTISPLTAGTKYTFTLFTVFENLTSSGYIFEAFTLPRNAEEFGISDQTNTSITLKWKKVENIKYTIEYGREQINISASEGPFVTERIPDLMPMTEYNFTLFTVFEDVRSSGVSTSGYTAPSDTKSLRSVGQNETSITLQWDKVEGNVSYILKLVSGKDISVPQSEGHGQVTYTIQELTSGTEYLVNLFTVFKNIRSSGVNITAATAPQNVKAVEVVGQNETSITLKWDKVKDISTYILLYDDESISRTFPENTPVTLEVPSLTAGTKYRFTLLTVFAKINSTGFQFTAVTAPRDANAFDTVGQTETSVTLEWEKVDNILSYILLFEERNITVPASEGHQVTHTIRNLTSMTKYNVTLFAEFENVTSRGKRITAVTAPRNAGNFRAVDQTETSITLQWEKVEGILKYFLFLDGNKHSELSEEMKIIPDLKRGTKYDFGLFTVFENISSSGTNIPAATVPSRVNRVIVTERSEDSVTLEWAREEADWSYILQMNGENVHPSHNSADAAGHSFTSLQPGTEYPFSVITTFFKLNSTVYEDFTVTKIKSSGVKWDVTNSSIQGVIEGLFTNATASNNSQTHVSTGGNNVSFTGLYPGATYDLKLVYEKKSKVFDQYERTVTIIPPDLVAHCENAAGGYSIRVVWNKPQGVWTEVEVKVKGKSMTLTNETQYVDVSGFLPARSYEVSVASRSSDVLDGTPFVFVCLTDPTGVIAGSVFAVLLFAILVCVIVFIFLKRPDIIRRKKSFIGGSKQSQKKDKAISAAKFPDHFYQLSADENLGFTQEYESLVPVGTEQTRREACQPENKPRNRFNNVLPYDWCRVKLTTAKTFDYINASYLPGYNSNREYIATQGPLPSTVNDFWRMVWEQRVRGIVMVTNCIEGGRTKCERYWPADTQPCSYGDLSITMTSELQEPNWTLREFRVKHSDALEERTVKHFHFTAWPDHGVPQGTADLIQFRGLVRQHIEKHGAGAPTVVHCSAGVGRTGTTIALDVLLQQLEKERAVGINSFVHKMRLCRPYMVQTESQYVFLHQCIMDCLQQTETMEENLYENVDTIYVNATALRQLHTNA